MTGQTITNFLLKLFELASMYYGVTWFHEWLKRRKDKKKDNMDMEYDRRNVIIPILNDIRHQLDSDRVLETVFSNGDVTFSGYHMKKLSIISEVHIEGLADISHHFQLIPTKKFDRTLSELYDSSDDYLISDETTLDDELSDLKKLFGLNYTLMVMIRDKFGRWVGNITVCFNEPRELSSSEIAFVKAQASRIGSLK